MFTKILLAVDLNEVAGSIRAAQAALKLADAESGELHVVNVVPDTGMAIVSASLGPDYREKMLKEARSELTSFLHDISPDLPEKCLHVAQGTIYDQIIKTADAIGADTIVVGAHSPDLKDYLVGTNAARVVRHADQTVLVVR